MPGERESKSIRPFWKRGAGVIAAAAVIVLFILAATFLKSLVAGLLLAYLFLPLEKFFERMFRKISPRKKRQKNLYVNLGLGAVVTFLGVSLLVLLFGLTFILLPTAVSAGNNLKDLAAKTGTLAKLNETLAPYIPKEKEEAPSASPGTGTATAPEKEKKQKELSPGETLSRHLQKELLPQLRKYIRENFQIFSEKSLQAGKRAFSLFSHLVSGVSTFLLDLLLALFFFLFFLQKMALFTDAFTPGEGRKEKNSPGKWAVKGIFSSNWLPDVSEKTQEEAAGLIDRICLMFQKWLRGYFSIIVVETILYITLFYLFSIPYAFLLGVIAGLTILLPFLGPLASMTLTVSVILAFSHENTAFSLVGALLSYGAVNGLLEQFYLYPRLVGGAIGLTTLETIIVVLLGGLFAGITGMILAVPAAAILKMLIPELYRLCQGENSP